MGPPFYSLCVALFLLSMYMTCTNMFKGEHLDQSLFALIIVNPE